MRQFKQIVDLLSQLFPRQFSCKSGKSGLARGLEVHSSRRRNGRAFVYEPDQNGGFLLALHEDDGDHTEVWATRGVEEVVERLLPWAFPSPRTLPPPIDGTEEKHRLEKIAQGLAARKDVECVKLQPKATLLRLLTREGRSQFEHDLASLNPERTVPHFPWDPAGRLALNTTVLLNVYDTTMPPGKDRDLCLAVVGPARRQDKQRIAIQLTDLIVVNQTHRWERSPWLWQDVEAPASEFWGAELIQASAAKPTRRQGAPRSPTPESQRASRSLQLLEEGHIEEALALFGVSLSPDLHRLLGGERIKPPACCAHPNEAWTRLLVGTLRQSAPWLLPRAVLDEAERLARWAAQKKGRQRRAPDLKLVIFPGQHHMRKASLMLTGDVDGRNPRLVIEATASNARIPDTAWKRPLVVDFIRRGVSFPTIPSRRVVAVKRNAR